MKKFLSDLQRHLLTGVSYMIPFVVPGGILIAMGFLFGGIYVYESEGFASQLFWLGKDAFGLMVGALAGYIAYSISDRPGIAPGFVGGMVADRIGAGFIGGILAGLLAGYIVEGIKKISVPGWLRSLMPVLVIPLFATAIVGLLMIYVIGGPVAWLNTVYEQLPEQHRHRQRATLRRTDRRYDGVGYGWPSEQGCLFLRPRCC